MEFNKSDLHFPDAQAVLSSDEGLQLDILAHKVKHKHIWVQRNRDTCLLMIGESWVYGESLPGISTSTNEFDLEVQLKNTVGPKLSLLLDSDLYQYAVPANSNAYNVETLKQILPKLIWKYKKVYVCIQITEPSREHRYEEDLKRFNSKLQKLFIRKGKETLNFSKWLELYDEYLMRDISDIVKPHNGNVSILLWKNFCKFNSSNTDGLKFLHETWIEFGAKTQGIQLQSPAFYVAGWIDWIQKEWQDIEFDPAYILPQLDLIEKSNKFLADSSEHVPHPNSLQHSLWALNLYLKSGWAINGH